VASAVWVALSVLLVLKVQLVHSVLLVQVKLLLVAWAASVLVLLKAQVLQVLSVLPVLLRVLLLVQVLQVQVLLLAAWEALEASAVWVASAAVLPVVLRHSVLLSRQLLSQLLHRPLLTLSRIGQRVKSAFVWPTTWVVLTSAGLSQLFLRLVVTSVVLTTRSSSLVQTVPSLLLLKRM
jgi:hypothetical protein